MTNQTSLPQSEDLGQAGQGHVLDEEKMLEGKLPAGGTDARGRRVKGHRPKVRTPFRSIVKHALLIVAAGVMIYPLLWMVASSFRPNDLIFREAGLVISQVD